VKGDFKRRATGDRFHARAQLEGKIVIAPDAFATILVVMNAVYHLDAEELDETFLQGLKQTFQKRRLEIIVREEDETEYLLSSPANRRELMKAFEDVQAGRNVVVPDQVPFQS